MAPAAAMRGVRPNIKIATIVKIADKGMADLTKTSRSNKLGT